MDTKKEITVFYSWQSGPHDKENRYLIQDCLRAAAKRLAAEDIAVRIEQDTRGESGAADIPRALFEKIASADLFVGDISTINHTAEAERRTPNPNVMIELGYAAAALRWERIIPVCNTKFGRLEDAPFDIRHRRILAYDTSGSMNEAKKRLTDRLVQTIRSAGIRQPPEAPPEKAKADIFRLLWAGLRSAWAWEQTEDEEDEICRKGREERYTPQPEDTEAPLVLESHLRQADLLKDGLSEREFSLLTAMLGAIRNMRDGTEDAYGWEFGARLAARCFEPVWMEYQSEMAPLPMERCLRRETVQLLDRLLPPERQISYDSARTAENGELIFFAAEDRVEARSRNGELLVKTDLDGMGRITGWKKTDEYQGEFAGGLRHGAGTEYSRALFHIGEIRLAGRWDRGRFTEGTVHGAILHRDEEAEDGYAYEPSEDDLPLQLCSSELTFYIRQVMPDECRDLYVADLRLQDGKYDIVGTPRPLCRLRGGEGTHACMECPADEMGEPAD